MGNETINTDLGHWLLSKMGKKVLRPGGRQLTQQLLTGLDITEEDKVIEFAPGIGWTMAQVLKYKPRSYTGIELNGEATRMLREKLNGTGGKIIQGDASRVDLPDGSATKLYGEAMLTMQADQRKSRIIKEAFRLLEKGGRYGVHELGLMPNDISTETKTEIQRELAKTIHVNARPLTRAEWVALFEKEGFRVKEIFTNPMLLLEAGRVLDDEGLFRSLKIGFNIFTHPYAKKRILHMRKVFRKYKKEMNAIAIIAEKP